MVLRAICSFSRIQKVIHSYMDPWAPPTFFLCCSQSMSRQDLASTSRTASLSEIEAGAFGSVRVEVLADGDVVAVKYLRRVRAHYSLVM